MSLKGFIIRATIKWKICDKNKKYGTCILRACFRKRRSRRRWGPARTRWCRRRRWWIRRREGRVCRTHPCRVVDKPDTGFPIPWRAQKIQSSSNKLICNREQLNELQLKPCCWHCGWWSSRFLVATMSRVQSQQLPISNLLDIGRSIIRTRHTTANETLGPRFWGCSLPVCMQTSVDLLIKRHLSMRRDFKASKEWSKLQLDDKTMTHNNLSILTYFEVFWLWSKLSQEAWLRCTRRPFKPSYKATTI